MKILNICILFLLFTVVFMSCSVGVHKYNDTYNIKIGVTSYPHGEILNNIKKIYNLDFEIINYIDYNTLNDDLVSGKIQGNFFQTRDYLKNFNLQSDIKLVELAGVHVEPMIVYSKKYRAIENIGDGDIIYIPDDVVNSNRALSLLEDAGLIKISRNLDNDKYKVIENSKNLVINEVNSTSLPYFYEEGNVTIINTNVALENGIYPHISGIYYEESFLEDEGKVNVFVTIDSMKTSVELKRIAQLLNSYETYKFISEKYRGFVKPLF